MNIKKIMCLICSLAIFVSISVTAFAEGTEGLVQATVVDDKMDLFVVGDIYLPDVSVKIANENVQVIDKGTISEKNIRFRTTILIDSTKSVSENMRDSTIQFIRNMIRDIGENEEIRIATFDSQVKILQDFSSDRYDLDGAVDSINFDGKQSALFDAIYNTLPEIKASDKEPCFYRTIVLSDGADSAAGGVTKEELFIELKAETFPIDAVCISEDEPKNANKNLSSLTRISNGRYFSLNSQTDIGKLQQDLSVDNYKWIRAEIPRGFLDGSLRQVDVTDGNTLISFDLKMKIFDAIEEAEALPAETQPVVEETAETSADEAPEEDSEENSEDEEDDEDDEDDEEEEDDDSESKTYFWEEIEIDANVLVIIGGALAVVVIIIITAVAAKRAGKKKTQQSDIREAVSSEATEFCSSETEFVGGGGDNCYTIKLVNIDSPGQNWVMDVSDIITIGRVDTCTIALHDKSVSRVQCLIDAGANGLYVTNKSESNITRLNNAPLVARTQLHSDDELKIGRVTLRVEYIQIIGTHTQNVNVYSGVGGDETQNIFR